MNNPTPLQNAISRAVWIGLAWVNLPVLAIMCGGWAIFVVWVLRAVPPNQLNQPISQFPNSTLMYVIFASGMIGPWLAAWLWWSFNVPKWRIWALELTRDWPALEPRAIRAGLIWSERTWFGRLCAATEIWSQTDRKRFADLRRAGTDN